MQTSFNKMFSKLLDEDEEEIKVVAMVNANCKGYCRVLLDQTSIEFFLENLSQVDTVNRCYLWRILFDHVRLLKISPMDYITAVQSHLLNEPEGQIVTFILEKVCWIVEHGLVENSADAKFNEYAVNLTLDVLGTTLVDKMRGLPAEKQSDRTLLMDAYIKLLPVADNYNKLIDMVIASNLAVDNQEVGPLNKLQRYACLRKCAAAVSSNEEALEIKALIEAEKKKNYSNNRNDARPRAQSLLLLKSTTNSTQVVTKKQNKNNLNPYRKPTQPKWLPRNKTRTTPIVTSKPR